MSTIKGIYKITYRDQKNNDKYYLYRSTSCRDKITKLEERLRLEGRDKVESHKIKEYEAPKAMLRSI